MSKGEKPNTAELKERAEARKHLTQQQITQEAAAPDLMNPHGIKARECLACDTHPNPIPTMFVMDTSGSMKRIPYDLVKGGLPHLLERQSQMGSIGNGSSQICMCGNADLTDKHPFQFGQFEGDNRIDDWLTRIQIGGGGGSEIMHEAYTLGLYAASRKTKCACWKRRRKGHLFITGDELCNPILTVADVARIFGDTIKQDLSLEALLRETRKKWFVSFLYVHTGSYREQGETTIWPFWQNLLGNDAYRLDAKATGLPELVNAIIGINEGQFTAEQVPQDLLELGCEAEICKAVAASLRLPEPTPGDVQTQETKEEAKPKPRRLD